MYGYEKLVEYVVKKTKKQYLIDIVNKASNYFEKAKTEISSNPTVQELKDIIIKSIQRL